MKTCDKENGIKLMESVYLGDKTFENFIINEANSAAASAVWACVSSDEYKGSICYLYGPTQCGKTHLLSAACNEFKKAEDILAYVTANDFVTNVISTIKQSAPEVLYDYMYNLRNLDALIIDDFQFLSGKDMSSNALFEVIDVLMARKARIIIAADKIPDDMEFSDRHKARLNSGVIVEIKGKE